MYNAGMEANTPTKASLREDMFLEQLASCGLPARSAKMLGDCNASNFYKKRAKDPEFAQRWQSAMDEFAERIEAEAFRRAVQGICKPVVYQGNLTYLYKTDEHGRTQYEMVDLGERHPKTGEPMLSKVPIPQLNEDGTPKVLALQEYSDSLLALLLKAKCAGYKDKVEISNAPGEVFKTEETPIQIARQVAFALALGLKQAERLEASGEDLA